MAARTTTGTVNHQAELLLYLADYADELGVGNTRALSHVS
jgi:hypothetical protein